MARPNGELQPDDAVSRLGGDEFSVLLDSLTDPSDAMRVAQRILAAMAQPLIIGDQELQPSVSVGIAVNTTTHERIEDLIQEADVAMRRAKSLGGNRCEVFDEAMHTSAVRRLRLEAELKKAIAKREFRVHYQPVVDLASNKVLGFEALLRWQHPEQGLISPAKFLEVAEDTGLLVSIGQWLLSDVGRQVRAWHADDPSADPPYVSVNISSRQFADATLVDNLRAVLQHTPIPSPWLRLELSESVVMTDARLTANVLLPAASARRRHHP